MKSSAVAAPPWRRRPAPKAAAGSAAGGLPTRGWQHLSCGRRRGRRSWQRSGACGRLGHCWNISVPTRTGRRRTARAGKCSPKRVTTSVASCAAALGSREAQRSTNSSSARARFSRVPSSLSSRLRRAFARLHQASSRTGRSRCPTSRASLTFLFSGCTNSRQPRLLHQQTASSRRSNLDGHSAPSSTAA